MNRINHSICQTMHMHTYVTRVIISIHRMPYDVLSPCFYRLMLMHVCLCIGRPLESRYFSLLPPFAAFHVQRNTYTYSLIDQNSYFHIHDVIIMLRIICDPETFVSRNTCISFQKKKHGNVFSFIQWHV